jgi:hypothetical protein
MPGQTPKGDLLGGRRASVPAAGHVVMSSDDHAAELGQIDQLSRCIRSIQRQRPLRNHFAEILPMRVTLDPVYCTLAIATCRKR